MKDGTPPGDLAVFEAGRRASAAYAAPAAKEWRGLSLLQVATGQRALLRLILAGSVGICGLGIAAALTLPETEDWPLWFSLVFCAFQLAYTVLLLVVMFRFFRTVVGSAALVCVGLAALPIPLLGLGITVAFNTIATRALRANGVRVGFLGTRKKDLDLLASHLEPNSGPTAPFGRRVHRPGGIA